MFDSEYSDSIGLNEGFRDSLKPNFSSNKGDMFSNLLKQKYAQSAQAGALNAAKVNSDFDISEQKLDQEQQSINDQSAYTDWYTKNSKGAARNARAPYKLGKGVGGYASNNIGIDMYGGANQQNVPNALGTPNVSPNPALSVASYTPQNSGSLLDKYRTSSEQPNSFANTSSNMSYNAYS